MKFHPDSIPSQFAKLKQYYHNPTLYLSQWNEMKRNIDAKKGDKISDLHFLYRDRHSYHYNRGELDSLKKYTQICKELCLKLNDEYYYYRSWNLLCELLLFTNAREEGEAEYQKMHNDALSRKSEIGMAYSSDRIGMGFATRKEYAKAEPYIQQAMQLFEKKKCWNEYITLASNYIIILQNTNQDEEANRIFHRLDSLANTFIEDEKVILNASRIMMIKDMASEMYNEPKDTTILKKYLKEMELVYQKAPNVSKIYMFNSRIKYAELKNDLAQKIAYQDSSAQYYLHKNNMINLSVTYSSMAKTLHKANRHEEAYQKLKQYVVLQDSIHRADFQQQLNEISTRYNMNKLELEAQKERIKARNMQYYYACTLIAILAVTLIIGIKFYLHKLKSNRLLKRQAQELTVTNKKLQKAQLIKTAFIQNMNHEVRTPLNAIVGFSECLAEIPMEPADVKEISITIKKNSDKLLKIISDMISIANLDSDETVLTYQEFSVDKLCTDLLKIMQEHVQPGVRLYYTPCETDFLLKSNRETAYQILTNLTHNALKFTENGEVEISYQINNNKKELRFFVRDTGPGVKSELKEEIFERFYKVDSFVPGAGLGLSLCRILASRLDAQVYLDDNYREGCLFVFAHRLSL